MKDKDYNNAIDVSVDFDGRKYSGRYIVKNSIITVFNTDGETSTQLGSIPAENLAKIILSEIANKSKNSGL